MIHDDNLMLLHIIHCKDPTIRQLGPRQIFLFLFSLCFKRFAQYRDSICSQEHANELGSATEYGAAMTCKEQQ